MLSLKPITFLDRNSDLKFYFCGVQVHEKYMRRCLELAQNGVGRSYPNPLVGSVIVCNKQVIGEGWHKKAGGAHAEVNAIKAVKEKTSLAKATIYVNLEPCSHYGKTPPCSNLILQTGIRKVVIGSVDPFAEVSGRGIKKLLAAGCEVVVGVLEEECRRINARFFTFHLKNRPYIILKWAQSADGFLSPKSQSKSREPFWITNNFSRQLVHKWRAEEQAILVGTGTAVQDNPKLNTRLWKGNDPLRLVLDRSHRIPRNSFLLDGKTKTIVFCEAGASSEPQENLTYEELDFGKPIIPQLCANLYQKGLQSVIIEGGGRTLQSFISENTWDEARVFTGSGNLVDGTKAPEFSGKLNSKIDLLSDQLKIYKND